MICVLEIPIHSNGLCGTWSRHPRLWRETKEGRGVVPVHLFAFAIFICLRDIRLQVSLSMDCLLKSGVAFVDWSSQELFSPKWGDGGGVRHLQSPTTVTKAYLGSASTCQTVNKAPGRTPASWTPWSNTKQTTTRCACWTDSPSASCHAENVYPICQDNLSSNKPWAYSLEQPEFSRYNVTLFFSPIFL